MIDASNDDPLYTLRMPDINGSCFGAFRASSPLEALQHAATLARGSKFSLSVRDGDNEREVLAHEGSPNDP